MQLKRFSLNFLLLILVEVMEIVIIATKNYRV